ncbi:transposase [Chrysiogenes arsenatis]|uniref:transposase n=1 Tax=Chrysiogenes arsenatis TaxID=309797 RepID=UPI000407C29A|nr:transposase [Chrysiogenes arsenatis]
MTIARNQQVFLDSTPYYHCISRCVRRAFLCGEDVVTGQNFDHRKQWIIDRMLMLSGIFAIDVCAYALMSNHYHLVLRVDVEQINRWSDEEILEQWCKLFSGNTIVQKHRAGDALDSYQQQKLQIMITEYRRRLCDISWYMRSLNESIARQANLEDNCTGRFWEGRFKSQALLDMQAVLTCMAYVDLNPIRAGIAVSPERSDFTSIQARIRLWALQEGETALGRVEVPNSFRPAMLLPFDDNNNDNMALPFTSHGYFELVDWIGRCARPDKRGAIAESAPDILLRLGIEPEFFLKQMRSRHGFHAMMGTVSHLREAAQRCGKRCVRGIGVAKRLFGKESA